MIARCGFQCFACLAFIGNIRTPEDQAYAAAAWGKYYGLDLRPEEIRCNGCLAEDRGPNRFPEPDCFFSLCVREKGLDNCASCPGYPCKELAERMRDCDAVCRQFRGRISRAEYTKCIAPYDLRTTLEKLRK